MANSYFSDREKGPSPRTNEEISTQAWKGISAVIQSLISQGSFGYKFPDDCPDGRGIIGTDERNMAAILQAEIPGLFQSSLLQTWDGSPPNINYALNIDETPPTLAILDLIEFCYRNVAKPIQGSWHKFFDHYHLTFDREMGQNDFKQDINRILARNGLVYELQENGQIIRIAPPVLRELLHITYFKTGDIELDNILETARKKYLDPNINIRRESLEKLWDAWERLKTIEQGKDKKASVKLLLDKAASEPNFRSVIEEEAKSLTSIGNDFQIRHSEVNKTPIKESNHIDYLFHRLFSFLNMLITFRK